MRGVFTKVISRIKNKLAGDFIIGNSDNPYLIRWYIIPRNRWFNIYLHKFLKDDYDEALHDHPWYSLSFLLKGQYREITRNGVRIFKAGSVIYREAEYAHRIELIDNKTCWTLFLTGPEVREWGFLCPKGWRHWKEFVSLVENNSKKGKGCG